MKKYIITIILFISVLVFSSCQKSWESLRKGVQVSNRNYTIKQYSGGVLINTYSFKGTLNDSKGSDGYYFYKGDTLVELSGDLIIKSTN